MSNTNFYNKISTTIRNSLPFYLQQDGDYEQFIRFLEVYYEWMESDQNPQSVGHKLEDYNDLDKTLDIFVDEFQNALAPNIPRFTKIKSKEALTEELRSNLNLGISTNSELEYIEYDDFLAGGVMASFPLSYYEPSYYATKDLDTSIVDLKVYINPSNPNAAESTIDRSGNTTVAEVISSLSFPADFTLLTFGTDYTITNKKLQFIDSNGLLLPPTDQVAVRVMYTVRKKTAVTENDLVVSKKTRYSNKKQFLKFMKEFYQSKGSKKSYEFIFRALFNEDIDLFYPKTKLFKTSDGDWRQAKSVRTIPNNKVIKDPIRIVGKTSQAIATVENLNEFSINSVDVREYFLTNIFGTFISKEVIEIHQKNGVITTETLHDCIVGFDIVNAGSNYPNDVYLSQYITNEGTGTGFAGKITATGKGSIDSIEVTTPGNNYVTNDPITFQTTSSGGGALAKISKIDGSTSRKNLSWVQPLTNPQFYFDIADHSSADFSYAYSRNMVVTVSNEDSLYDNVLLLTDFENIAQNGRGYVDYIDNHLNIRTNTTNSSPAGDLVPMVDATSSFGQTSVRPANGFIEFTNFFKDAMNTTASFTVDFWIYPDDINQSVGSGGTIFGLNDSVDETNSMRLYQAGTGTTKTDQLILDVGGTEYSFTKPTGFDTQWNHIAVQVTASTAKVYINGVREHIGGSYSSILGTNTTKLVIGATLQADGTYVDFDKSYYNTFRITSGERFVEYVDGSDTKIYKWSLDPIEKISVARHAAEAASYNSTYYYDIVNSKVVIMQDELLPDNAWNDSSSLATIVTTYVDSYPRLVEPKILPSDLTVRLKYVNESHGPMTSVNLISGGSSYDRIPIGEITTSAGTGAVITPKSNSIGTIKKISLSQSDVSGVNDGFGAGYTVAPTLDLSTLGDGTAQVTPILGPLCIRDGIFMDDSGFLSSERKVHDGYLYQDYSYVIRVSRNISEWRDIIKKLVHPTGLMMFGEVTFTSKPEPKKLQPIHTQLMYEIIKNVDLSTTGHETITYQYATAPTTIIELNQLNQI
jgi:hypothetical protein